MTGDPYRTDPPPKDKSLLFFRLAIVAAILLAAAWGYSSLPSSSEANAGSDQVETAS